MILHTGDAIDGYSITAYLGLVSTEAVMGISVARELMAGITDTMGGRAKGYEKEIHAAKAAAVDELIRIGSGMGADAVIGIRFDTDYIGGGKMSMIMVSVSGSAVKLAQAQPAPVRVVGGPESRSGGTPAAGWGPGTRSGG